jgi:hypothetical protein
MNRKTVYLISSLVLTGTLASSGQVLVNWVSGADNTLSAGVWGANDFNQPNGNFGLGDPLVDDGRKLRPFDLEGTPLSTSGPSSTWYVGFEFIQGDYSNGVNDGTRSYGPNLDVRLQYSDTQPGEMYLLQMWKKSDFANLSTVSNITFDENSSFSMSRSRAENNAIRWVVQDGSTFYISESTASTLTDPNSANWAVYNPTNTLRGFRFTDDPNDFGPVTFSDVQAVGFLNYSWINDDFVSSSRTWSTLGNVQITAIPEPSTYAALIGLAALGFVFWRRRRR